MRRALVLAAVLGALVVPAGANASEIVDRNARGVSLQVNAKGEALISYAARGKRWNVLAWGAVDAVQPTPGRKQVSFKLDYAGGWGKYRSDYWKTFTNVCGPYTGPKLAWFVKACTAPDGSHWALQAWQRMLPNYGLPADAKQSAWELRLSHWTSELPVLEVNMNWAYRKYDHVFGSFSYQGKPVHGFKSTSTGVPLDTFGRNLYVDTFNSVYGTGWRRENSFLMHKGSGKFCYGFYPHGNRPSGMGERYRATIIGPGVLPDVTWQGQPLGSYDQQRDLALHAEQKQYFPPGALCRAV